MSAVLRKLLLLIPASLLFSAAAWAQTTAFEGVVKDPAGKPLAGATIHLDRQDVKGNYKVKTDKKGHYFYGGLPLGNYKITVEVDGKEVMSDNKRGGVGDTVQVNFDLKSESAGAAQEPDESGRALSAKEKAEKEKSDKERQAAMAKNKALNDAFNAGKEAAQANNWNGAIENFEKASELDPAQHVVWGNLADSYVSRSKTKTGADKEADLGKAAESYQKAIAAQVAAGKGEDAAYHNNYALVLAAQKKFDEAQAELTKAATIDPPNAGKYYFNLGAALTNAGQIDPALAAFRKAVELDPNYADAYFQIGVTNMGKATTDAAGKMTAPPGTAEAFQKYLDLKPTGPDAETAKLMMTQLGATVQTNFSKGPANQKKKQ